jgi:ABC-type sugar transport system permease subunit
MLTDTPVARATTHRSAGRARAGRPLRKRRAVAPYLFLAPFYVLFAVFFIFPIGFTAYLSLSSWDEVGPIKFVGLANYSHLFHDPTFLTVVWNTVVYMLGSLVIAFVLALPLALALNSKYLVGRSIARLLYFAPIVTPGVAIAVVFNLIFGSDPGVVNGVLQAFGLKPVSWLLSTTLSKIVVLILVAWQYIGLTMLYFLAGLQGVSPNLREAAQLDGASGWGVIRHVVLPSLRPMMLFVLVTTLIGSSQIFDQPFVLTAGGPINSSLSIANYIYQQGLSDLDFGYASTIGVVLLVVVTAAGIFLYRRLTPSEARR